VSWIREKVALVTGANVGIGLETARGLARAGAAVIMTARDPDRGRAAVEDVKASTGRDDVELLHLDLASFDSVRRAAEEVKSRHDRLHLLVNNAGLVLSERRETEDGLEATMGINHFGPFLFTRLLQDLLRASAPARIVNVSSDAHRRSPGLDFDDLMRERRKYSGMAAYCDSKLANILFTRELARRLDGSGVVAHALHPGVVRTGFAQDGDVKGVLDVLVKVFRPLFLSPADGAKTSLHVATSDDAGATSGEYWSKERRTTPEAPARDDAAAGTLWEVSEASTRR
jgi:NAD(P)-dependent dehydrogenase (short-subunit alcohol dehydrogenase family)